MKKDIFTIFFAAVLVLSPFFASAQTDIGRRIILSATPTNPGPNESVNLTVSSSEVNVNLANIEWSVDGKSVKKGVGMKTFAFTTGANGNSNTVNVRVTPESGTPIEESMNFAPSDIDIIWEAQNSYVPPFYKGKAFPVTQSGVKIVAMPNVKTTSGKMVDPSDFAYVWRKDGLNMQGQSGYGKQSLTYMNQLLENTNRVDVSASNGVKKVDDGIIISYSEPEFLFYEVDSFTGAKYQKALQDGFRPAKQQLSLVVEPYFLPTDWRTEAGIKLEWKLGNQAVASKNKNSLVINTGTQPATFNINLIYNESKKLFRSFTESLTVNPR